MVIPAFDLDAPCGGAPDDVGPDRAVVPVVHAPALPTAISGNVTWDRNCQVGVGWLEHKLSFQDACWAAAASFVQQWKRRPTELVLAPSSWAVVETLPMFQSYAVKEFLEPVTVIGVLPPWQVSLSPEFSALRGFDALLFESGFPAVSITVLNGWQ